MRVHVRKKVKRFNNTQCRVLKIDRSAIEEILFEYMCENEERLFDILNVAEGEVELSMRWNDVDDTCICVAHNYMDRRLVDLDAFDRTVPITAESVFMEEKKYIDFKL